MRTEGEDKANGRATPSARPTSRGLLRAGVHLAVLSAFALAQPLFDLLSRSAEFFAVRGSSRWEIVIFAVAVTLVPPAALLLAEFLAGLVDARLARALHLVFVAALAALVALQALKRIGDVPGSLLIAGAALAGAGFSFAASRIRAIPSLLTLLAPAPLFFLGLFLLHSPVAKLVFPAEARAASAARVSARTPVVMVVFDEFPATSLLAEDRRIDAVRYPNFADLARGSTWFRNAYTVHDQTTQAVPAILSGRYSREGELPVFSDHPDNLFSLLGGAYRLEVSELATRLCPRELCKEERGDDFSDRMHSLFSDVSVVYLHVLLPKEFSARLPAVTEDWGNFGRAAAAGTDDKRSGREKGRAERGSREDRQLQFESFVGSISRGDRPRTLYFLHVLLPHRPWAYLPSGKHYGNAENIFGRTDHGTWSPNKWVVARQYQRYLLQLGFVDRLLGKLLRKLRATGLYDRSLIIVTADHGRSFLPGQPSRAIRKATVPEVASVPLFVKTPRQRRGSVVDRTVETLDVLPTIADVLAVRVPWKLDGRSVLGRRHPRRGKLVIVTSSGGRLTVPTSSLERKKYAIHEEKLAIFGSGERSLYRLGPHRELLGRSVEDVPVHESSELRAEVDGESELAAVDPDSDFVPSHITGRITGAGAHEGLPVAIAVNGRLAAVSPTFRFAEGLWFEALVPESVFRAGSNEVSVFALSSGGGSFRLERIGGTTG